MNDVVYFFMNRKKSLTFGNWVYMNLTRGSCMNFGITLLHIEKIAHCDATFSNRKDRILSGHTLPPLHTEKIAHCDAILLYHDTFS